MGAHNSVQSSGDKTSSITGFAGKIQQNFAFGGTHEQTFCICKNKKSH